MKVEVPLAFLLRESLRIFTLKNNLIDTFHIAFH